MAPRGSVQSIRTRMRLVLLGGRDGVVRPDRLAARSVADRDTSESEGVSTHCHREKQTSDVSIKVNQTSHTTARPCGSCVHAADMEMAVLTNTRGKEREENEGLGVAAQALDCRDGNCAAVLEGPTRHARRLDTGDDPEDDEAHCTMSHKRGQIQLRSASKQTYEGLHIQISSKRTVAQ